MPDSLLDGERRRVANDLQTALDNGLEQHFIERLLSEEAIDAAFYAYYDAEGPTKPALKAAIQAAASTLGRGEDGD
jgi:hypothetical protein